MIRDQKNMSDDQSHNVRAGLDYFITNNKTLGIVVNGTWNNNDIRRTSRIPIINPTIGLPEQVLIAP